MDWVSTIHFGFITLFTFAAMILDLRTRRIPNWLTVSGLVAALAFHTGTNGIAGLKFCLAGFAVGFGVLFVLWCIGGGGGGDVKLMGAIGGWMGATSTIAIFLLSTLFALVGLMGVIFWGAVTKNQDTSTPLLKKTIPYAIPAGLASWAVLLAKVTSTS